MADAMEEIVNEIEIYDRITPYLDHLDDIDSDGKKKFGNFKDVKSVAMSLVEKIDQEYKRFKSTVQLLREENKNVLSTKPEKYPEILKWNDQLHTILTFEDPNDSSTFFAQVFSRIEWIRTHRCDLHAPPMQFIIFQIYLTLISSQLKSFAINVLDLEYQYLMNKNITLKKLDDNIAKNIAIMRTMLQQDSLIFKRWFFAANNEINNHSPANLTRDVNFIELEQEYQLIDRLSGKNNDYKAIVPCSNPYEVDSKLDENNRNNKNFDRCKNFFKSCRRLEKITLCVNSLNPGICEWMELSTSLLHVNSPYQPDCPRGNEIIRSQAKQKHLCICLCEENSIASNKSFSRISSQFIESDVDNNMVITGVKFVKVNSLIHTQIKQAKILSGGSIDQKSAHWKPVENLSTADQNNMKSYIIISNVLKKINLNNLKCPMGNFVLTGVGLGISKTERNANRIVMFIRCHFVDFEIGKVLPKDTGIFEDLRPHEYKVMIGKMSPDKVKDSHVRVSSDRNYVEFTMSSPNINHEQSVIPSFDARNVMSSPNVPLTGIELYHKGGKESGGILAYKLFSMVYSNFL